MNEFLNIPVTDKNINQVDKLPDFHHLVRLWVELIMRIRLFWMYTLTEIAIA